MAHNTEHPFSGRRSRAVFRAALILVLLVGIAGGGSPLRSQQGPDEDTVRERSVTLRHALAVAGVSVSDGVLEDLARASLRLSSEGAPPALAALDPGPGRVAEIDYSGPAVPPAPSRASVVSRQPIVPYAGPVEENHHLVDYWNRRPDPQEYADRLAHLASEPAESPRGKSLPAPWKQLGIGIHHADGTHHVTGRATSFLYAYDAAQDRTVPWLASAGGGVWKQVFLGILVAWVPVTDALPGAPSVGAFWVDPADSSHLLVATGDHYRVWGSGLYRTQDGGASWDRISNVYYDSAFQLLQDRASPDRLLLATNNGIFRSANRGASWSRVAWGGFTDLVQDPSNSARWLAAKIGTGIVESTDNGQSFSPIAGTGGTGIAPGFDRISLAICDANPAWVYASVSNFDQVNGLYRSSDSGSSWVNIDGGDDISWGQAFHTNAIAVDPANCNRVLVGMGGFKVSQNAATASPTWTSKDGGHADYTSFTFAKRQIPGSTDVLVTNDGGLYVYDYATDSIDGTSNVLGLSLSQTMQAHRALASSRTSPSLGYAGLQDNGMVRLSRTASEKLRIFRPGDGGQVSIDPDAEGNIAFSSGAAYHRFMSTTGASGYVSVNCGLDNEWASSMLIEPTPGIADKRIYSYSTPKLPKVVGDTDLITYPLTASETLVVGHNGSGGSIALPNGAALPAILDILNAQFSTWGVPLEARDSDGHLEIRSTLYGAGEFVEVRSLNRGNENGTAGFGMTFRNDTGRDGELIDKSLSSSCDWRRINASSLPLSPVFNPKMVDKAANKNEHIFYVTGWEDARLVVFDTRTGSPGPPSMTWEDRTPPLPSGSQRNDAYAFADRRLPTTVYYTTGKSKPARAFLSTDAGVTWQDVTGNLMTLIPSAYLIQLVGNPTNLHELFIGSSVGVYRSDDRGATWDRYSAGLPAAPMILGLDVVSEHIVEPFLRLGTYGRGFWERPLGAPDPVFHDGFENGTSDQWSSVSP